LILFALRFPQLALPDQAVFRKTIKLLGEGLRSKHKEMSKGAKRKHPTRSSAANANSESQATLEGQSALAYASNSGFQEPTLTMNSNYGQSGSFALSSALPVSVPTATTAATASTVTNSMEESNEESVAPALGAPALQREGAAVLGMLYPEQQNVSPPVAAVLTDVFESSSGSSRASVDDRSDAREESAA